jgi:hypothetical protein
VVGLDLARDFFFKPGLGFFDPSCYGFSVPLKETLGLSRTEPAEVTAD